MIDRVIDNIRIKAMILAEGLSRDNEISKIVAGGITTETEARIRNAGLSLGDLLQKEIVLQCIRQNMIEELTLNRGFVLYNGLLIQKNSSYQSSYNDSLSYLKRISPNARHFMPKEAFEIIFNGLEGKLSGDILDIYDQMYNHNSEWLNVAFEVKGSFLIVYTNPGHITMGDSENLNDKLTYSEKYLFSIKGLTSKKLIYSRLIGDGFFERIHGRKIEDIFSHIDSIVNLPPEGMLYPCSRIYLDINADRKMIYTPRIFTRAVIPVDDLLR